MGEQDYDVRTTLSPSEQEQVQPAKIQILRISGEDNRPIVHRAQICFLKQCPDLIRLRWRDQSFCGVLSPMRRLANAIRDEGHRWEHLEALDLPNLCLSEDLMVVIESLQLTELNLAGGHFDLNCWKGIQERCPRHLTTLRILNLGRGCRSYQVPGSIIQGLLCSLSSLEELTTDTLTDQEILKDNRPWVCERLRVLILSFHLYRPSENQSLVFSRIGQLTRSEHLDLGMSRTWRWEGNGVIGLNPTLQKGGGLNELQTLRSLKRFICPYLNSLEWTKSEAQWALKYWPRLEGIANLDFDDAARELLGHLELNAPYQ